MSQPEKTIDTLQLILCPLSNNNNNNNKKQNSKSWLPELKLKVAFNPLYSPHMSQEEEQDPYISFQLGTTSTQLRPLGSTKTKPKTVISHLKIENTILA